MAYRPNNFGPGKIVALVVALLVQAALYFGLSTGLLQKATSNALQEIEATVLPPPPPPPETPPPPPPPVDTPPPYVPPPDVLIEAPSSASAPTQIQRTTPAPSGIKYPQPVGSLPDYPATEKRLGHEGKVVLALCVELDGSVSSATVKASSGFPALDQSALEWAKRVKWRPAVVSGQKQRMCYDQPYKFQLRNG